MGNRRSENRRTENRVTGEPGNFGKWKKGESLVERFLMGAILKIGTLAGTCAYCGHNIIQLTASCWIQHANAAE